MERQIVSALGNSDDASQDHPDRGLDDAQRARDSLARALRTALLHLDDPAYLRRHPLAAMLGDDPALPATSSSRAPLLRQRLIEGIELLRPPPSTPPHAASWRSYRLLWLRFVEARDATSVQEQMGLAKSQYYVELARAMERLAGVFAERWPANAGHTDVPPVHARVLGGGVAARAEPGGLAAGTGARLPSPLTSFVGRERELAAMAAMLTGGGTGGERARGHRLVTITGAAGAGKTRLSLQVAANLREAYGDRVFFVPLSSLDDSGLVFPAVCRALGFADGGARPLVAHVASALANYEVLLVLDNFEQVLDAAPAIAEVVRECPLLTVLATSRTPLRVYGEREFPLAPLAVPNRAETRRIDAMRANPAVRLFVDRAQAARPAFALTERNASAIADICRRLDGLPLAIELAAARIRLLSPEGLAERLDRRLEMLNTGPRDVPARQRSLRGAIAWSYNALESPEQALFRRLSVFVSGWTPEAATAVAGDEATLDALGALVNHSLVVREEDEDTGARFSMLETIGEYGRAMLEECGETEQVRERHAEYHARLVLEAEPYLDGPDQVAWVARLEREHENMQATLRWCLESGHVEQGLRLASVLAVVWRRRGEFTEGRKWLHELLDAATDAERTGVRAAAALWAGVLAVYQSDWPQARARYDESLAIATELGDRLAVARALTSLGYLAYFQGDDASAERNAQVARTIFHELGDREHSPNALDLLGHVAAARARRDEAKAHYEGALAIRQDLGDVASIGWSYHQLGSLALDEGDLAGARSWLERSLAIRRRVGDGGGAVLTLLSVARLVVAEGRPRLALQLAAAATECAQVFGMAPRPADEAKLERSLDLARGRLGADAARAAWDEGRALTIEEAMARASS